MWSQHFYMTNWKKVTHGINNVFQTIVEHDSSSWTQNNLKKFKLRNTKQFCVLWLWLYHQAGWFILQALAFCNIFTFISMCEWETHRKRICSSTQRLKGAILVRTIWHLIHPESVICIITKTFLGFGLHRKKKMVADLQIWSLTFSFKEEFHFT